jgi:hypothetical protein
VGPQKDKDVKVFDAPPSVEVSFSASLFRYTDRLEVHYRIENKGGEAIAVLDRLGQWGIGEEYEYSPQYVYVDLDGSVLRLIKGALTVPPGALPRQPPYGRPDGRLVAPGESIEEAFTVPVPVKVRNPYRRDTGLGQSIATKNAVVRVVEIAVGIVPQGGGSLFSQDHPAHPEVVSITRITPDPVERWQTIVSQQFDLAEDLPILDYQTVTRGPRQ